MLQGFLLPAAIGAGLSLISGRDPIQGALVGGVTGGLLGGGFNNFASALSGGTGTAATSSAPVLGGLKLEGARQAAMNEAANQAVSGTIGAGMNDYVGRFVPPHLVSEPVTQAASSTVPELMTNSQGIPVDAPEPTEPMLDPYTKMMIGNTAAQSLLQPNTSGIQVPQTEIKGSTEPKIGSPLNVLSPGDYGADAVTDQIGVSGSVYSMFPEKTQGFGGRGMFYR